MKSYNHRTVTCLWMDCPMFFLVPKRNAQVGTQSRACRGLIPEDGYREGKSWCILSLRLYFLDVALILPVSFSLFHVPQQWVSHFERDKAKCPSPLCKVEVVTILILLTMTRILADRHFRLSSTTVTINWTSRGYSCQTSGEEWVLRSYESFLHLITRRLIYFIVIPVPGSQSYFGFYANQNWHRCFVIHDDGRPSGYSWPCPQQMQACSERFHQCNSW